MKDRSHDEVMAELYREDPALALELMNSVLSDIEGDQGELLVIMRQLALAGAGLPAVAKSAEVNPTQLYRTLSAKGNPALKTFTAILTAMGLKLTVERTNASETPRQSPQTAARLPKVLAKHGAPAARAGAAPGPAKRTARRNPASA